MIDVPYVHYGHDVFKPELIAFPTEKDNNQRTFKPYGCFWGSRQNSVNSWRTWCESEHFDPRKIKSDPSYWDKTIIFSVPRNRILLVDSEGSWRLVKQLYGLNDLDVSAYDHRFDFKKMKSNGYAGIEVLISQWPPLYRIFYGWDCDSICVWDPSAVEVL